MSSIYAITAKLLNLNQSQLHVLLGVVLFESMSYAIKEWSVHCNWDPKGSTNQNNNKVAGAGGLI